MIHWADLNEVSASLGIRLLFLVYRVFGRLPVLLILYPVIFWFLIFSKVARRSSYDYLDRLYQYSGGATPKPTWLNVYRHIYAFGECILDKLIIWSGSIDDLEYSLDQIEAFNELTKEGKGAIIVVSHLGNLDFCRAIAKFHPNIDLTVLVHTTHAVKFNKLLKAINPDSALNIIQVSKFSMQDAMLLSEKIEKGGLIAIAGDRVPLMWGNTIPLSFLGSKADFPLGAYLLGKTLGCQLLSLMAIKVNGRYEVSSKQIADFSDPEKRDSMDLAAQKFVETLNDGCLKSPFQWFNFYPFWQKINHE
ncbi:acyltransferase [Polynucleobacter sp. MWH-Braz-FAM2G]|uniref:LpxL/LpxP family acyltransferase n=1 Tax=Polynucleobacter sp. MWH-Braz-FAM2G TaxID=1855883 RepID=UPI001BFEE2EA|nr:acyltransferase [Polynucleobacter sp. MWH-Braz-FAM2G]QWD91637.1 acyltransferase [Polynucleobacter sp. MWH-Braz-FAM2G]